jgi:hypothetical protein
MQGGSTLAYAASAKGHTKTLALLLANKAEINAAKEVQQLKTFKYILLIDNQLQEFNIALFMLSTILAHEHMNYFLT